MSTSRGTEQVSEVPKSQRWQVMEPDVRPEAAGLTLTALLAPLMEVPAPQPGIQGTRGRTVSVVPAGRSLGEAEFEKVGLGAPAWDRTFCLWPWELEDQ